MHTPTPDNVVRLTPRTRLGTFDCGDPDLNEFLLQDAVRYQSELLAVTYLVMKDEQIAAFYSLSNDMLTCDPAGDGKRIWNRMQRKIPNQKRLKKYPAVKIGRLGVATSFQKQGLGRQVLDWLKILFLTNNRTGCRFITVDAYNAPGTIQFYQRNDFHFLGTSDEKDETRHMYFDLKPFADLLGMKSETAR